MLKGWPISVTRLHKGKHRTRKYSLNLTSILSTMVLRLMTVSCMKSSGDDMKDLDRVIAAFIETAPAVALFGCEAVIFAQLQVVKKH